MDETAASSLNHNNNNKKSNLIFFFIKTQFEVMIWEWKVKFVKPAEGGEEGSVVDVSNRLHLLMLGLFLPHVYNVHLFKQKKKSRKFILFKKKREKKTERELQGKGRVSHCLQRRGQATEPQKKREG